MKPQDRYLMFVRWSEEDQLYVGYCPDLFPAGGVCHGSTRVEAFTRLCEVVDDTVMGYSTTTARLPSTSIFGVMPRPGEREAAMRPFTRCGAPSAVLTVT
jgi:predicted RNase H-like HicB family nuclease